MAEPSASIPDPGSAAEHATAAPRGVDGEGPGPAIDETLVATQPDGVDQTTGPEAEPLQHSVIDDDQREPGGDPGPQGATAAQVLHGYPVHAVCAMFPEMSDEDLDKLADDIRVNGLVNAIVLHEGQVVDGRHRLKASIKTGVEPRFEEWRAVYTGAMSISRWIWSTNGERRRLTADQVLTIRLDLCQWEKEEQARQRLAEGRRRGGQVAGRGRPKPDSSPMISSESYCATAEEAGTVDRPRDVRAEVAAEIGETEYRVGRAMKLKKDDPVAYEAVKAGRKKLRVAAKEAEPAIGQKKPKGTPKADVGEGSGMPPTSKASDDVEASIDRAARANRGRIRVRCRSRAALFHRAADRFCSPFGIGE